MHNFLLPIATVLSAIIVASAIRDEKKACLTNVTVSEAIEKPNAVSKPSPDSDGLVGPGNIEIPIEEERHVYEIVDVE